MKQKTPVLELIVGPENYDALLKGSQHWRTISLFLSAVIIHWNARSLAMVRIDVSQFLTVEQVADRTETFRFIGWCVALGGVLIHLTRTVSLDALKEPQ